MNPVTNAGRTGVGIGATANRELMDTFCYLGDMLSVEGDADAAAEASIRVGWNKFRQSAPLLSIRIQLYSTCARSSMLHVSETWPVRKKMRWHFRGQT